MMHRRLLAALLAAAVVLVAPRVGRADDEPAPRRAPVLRGGYPDLIGTAYLEPYYGWYYYNPYVAPFPAYGILPPPFATLQMTQGNLDRPRYAARPQRPPEKTASELVDDVTRFRFEVTAPTADAVVLVNGAKTTQTGLRRVYLTPPLVVDKYYTYTVEVRWTDSAGLTRSEKTSFDFLLGEPARRLQFPLQMMK